MAQLTAAEEAELAALEAELVKSEASEESQSRQERIRMMAEARGGGISAGPISPQATATGLRYGPVIAAGMMGGPVTGLAALGRAALLQGSVSAASEAGAETVEKFAEGKEYRPGQIISAGIRGSAPTMANAPIRNILMAAGTGIGGGAVEGKTSGSEMFWEGVKSGGPTAVLQSVGGASKYLGNLLSKGIQKAEDIERIGPGVEATIGQAFPEFAGLESRVAAQTGSQSVKDLMNRQADAITRAVVGVSGMAAETYPDIVRRVASSLSNMDPASIERLANEADAVNTARNAVEKARTGAQQSLLQESLSEAENEFRKRIDLETMAGGLKAGGVRPFQSAAMGREAESMFDDARKAYRARRDELYQPTKAVENDPVFTLYAKPSPNSNSVQDEVLNVLTEYPQLASGAQSAQFTPYLSRLEAILENRAPVSLNELRAIRENLYSAADYAGQAFGNKAQTSLRRVANRITETIDSQAPAAFGTQIASDLKTANRFVSEFQPRFDEFGVAQAFKPERMETAQMAESIRGRVAKQGVETPAFQNAITLLDDLKAAGAQGVPDSKKLADITRSGIVDRSLNAETGELNLRQLANDLNNIEQQSPGGLAKLGFGTTQELKRFVRFVTGLPEAEKVGPEKIVQLLNTETPAGFAGASRAVQALPDVATVDTVISALQRRATGGSKAAKEALDSIRAREIEDLLLEVRGGRRGAATGAVGILADPDNRSRVERILGPQLLSSIENTFIPGFRVMEEARQAAGQAGNTVRGAAFERVGRKVAELPVQAAGGKGAAGVLSFLGSMADAGGYALVSKVIAKGAGVSGMRSRRDFLNEMARISQLPQPGQIAALRRYAGEEPEAE
jgi:hypothetical protein